MKNGLSFREGTYMTENAPHQVANLTTILTYPAGIMSIGAHGNDFAAQFFESAQIFF